MVLGVECFYAETIIRNLNYKELENFLKIQINLSIKLADRACFFAKINSISPQFHPLAEEHKLKFISCPTFEKLTKVVNKFIRIVFNARDNQGIDQDQVFRCRLRRS